MTIQEMTIESIIVQIYLNWFVLVKYFVSQSSAQKHLVLMLLVISESIFAFASLIIDVFQQLHLLHQLNMY